MPLIFDFKKVSSIVFWIPIGIGFSNFIYSLLTVYSTSLVKIIPMKLHLLFDYLAGIILFSLAFIIPMEGFVKLFYITMGVGIILATSFTRTKESKNTY